MALLEKVNELNNRQRFLILLVLIAVIGVVFYMYGYTPKQRNIAGLESRLSSVQSELQQLRAIAAKLPEFKAQIKRYEDQLVEIRKKLPLDREIPGLLQSISQAGIESGMKFDIFRPQAEARKEFYSEVPVDIGVRGPFHNMVLFLDKIAHLPRIVNITNFSFGSAKDESGYLFITGNGLATTYRYNEKS